jgi:Lon protease-like protein
MKSVVEVNIGVPLREVAALFADPRNSPKWMLDVARYEPVSGEPGMPGSTYRLVPKTGKLVFLATVVSRDLPRELRLRLETSNIEVAITCTLTALSSTSTRLLSKEVFTFRGVLHSVFSLFASKSIRTAHRRHMEDFKQFAESCQQRVSETGSRPETPLEGTAMLPRERGAAAVPPSVRRFHLRIVGWDVAAGHSATASAGPLTIGVGGTRERGRGDAGGGPNPRGVFKSAGDRMQLGSHPLNDVVLDDRTVSRFHSEVFVDEKGNPWVKDLGSRNGTVVDGVRVKEAALRTGSLLQLGRVSFRFELSDEKNFIAVSEHESFGSLAGESVAARRSFALMESAAASDVTVLLEGETATGKRQAAESIHRLSARKGRPLLVVDCGAISANLLESELFGHEKGAFTGATTRRVGVFQEARGGTVLLDEIGDLPPELQPRLLRVLEARQIRPLGTNTYFPVDVRVIAATSRDLRAEVNTGRFRPDLYYRLAVLQISLPPPRQRPEDIPAAAEKQVAALDVESLVQERKAPEAMAPPMVRPGSSSIEDMPAVLPILPLRNSVFFPGGVLPLAIGRQKTIALLKDAIRDDQIIGVVTQRRAEEEDPGSSDLYLIGTVARIVKLMKMGEDNYSLVVQGLARVRVLELVQQSPYLKARVEAVEDKTAAEDVEVEALGISLKKLAREVIESMPELPAAATEMVESINHPGHLADLIAANIAVPIEQKQAVLETVDLKARMNLVLNVLVRKREILKLSKQIDERVKLEMSKAARTDFLRMQLEAIREKLGESSEAKAATRCCSFCGKMETEVKKLIAGPAAAVCNECIVRFSGNL